MNANTNEAFLAKNMLFLGPEVASISVIFMDILKYSFLFQTIEKVIPIYSRQYQSGLARGF